MSHTIKLDECLDLMRVLSLEVRAKYSIGDTEVSSPYIEQEYGVKINYDNILDPNAIVTFPSEAHYTMLMLKYYERTQTGFVAS